MTGFSPDRLYMDDPRLPQAPPFGPTGWIARFDAFAAMPSERRDFLQANSTIMQIPAGSSIFGPGSTADSFLLMLSGTVRVQKTSSNGREIVLYRISAGESCIMTTACLLAEEEYLAEGITETDVEAVAVSRQAFDELVSTCDIFRRFVFNAYSMRVTELFMLIDEIAFSRIDIRLAQRLVRLANDSGQLSITHQALALELGTAREVITRQLSEFQRRGWIEVTRGSIALLDQKALVKISESA